jgi:hypothetical protein
MRSQLRIPSLTPSQFHASAPSRSTTASCRFGFDSSVVTRRELIGETTALTSTSSMSSPGSATFESQTVLAWEQPLLTREPESSVRIAAYRAASLVELERALATIAADGMIGVLNYVSVPLLSDPQPHGCRQPRTDVSVCAAFQSQPSFAVAGQITRPRISELRKPSLTPRAVRVCAVPSLRTKAATPARRLSCHAPRKDAGPRRSRPACWSE